MLWFDWMTVAIALAVAILETIRGVRSEGMGLPLFDAAGLVVAALAATNLSDGVGQALHLQRSLVMTVLFVVLGIGAFIVGRWLFSVTDLSSQSLNGILSFVFGLVAGWVIAHMVLRIIIASQGATGPVGSMMENAPVAREVFNFRLWNKAIQFLFKVRLGPEIDPNVG